MDCQEVRELLDAYALGATEPVESEGLERHVADCIRCWEELSAAQRTAALLSLAVAIEEAPAPLRDRILSQAERERRREQGVWGIGQALRRVWPAAVGAVAVAGVAALVFAAALQMQVNDLRDDNSELALQIQGSGALLNQQQQVLAVIAAPDMQEFSVGPVSADSAAMAVYYWSEATGMGFLVCNSLPHLKGGEVHQVWFLTEGEWVSAGTLQHYGGISHLSMDLSGLPGPPEAIAVTVEGSGGSDHPTGEMVLREDLTAR